jgi:hypothetical protein
MDGRKRWSAVVAFVGLAAMLVLTALGGVGGSSGLPPAWGLTVAPYGVGGLLMFAGSLLLIREQTRARRRGAPRQPSGSSGAA